MQKSKDIKTETQEAHFIITAKRTSNNKDVSLTYIKTYIRNVDRTLTPAIQCQVEGEDSEELIQYLTDSDTWNLHNFMNSSDSVLIFL